MSNDTTSVRFGTIPVDGLNIAYREAGDPESPKLVLLHGFPASSHQYRDLVRALADRFHVIAPDYPGFGLSDVPDPAEWPYTFDRIAGVVERFLQTRHGVLAVDVVVVEPVVQDALPARLPLGLGGSRGPADKAGQEGDQNDSDDG